MTKKRGDIKGDTVKLRRLDLVGGEVELTPDHAERLLALEASMNVKNFELIESEKPESDK